MQTISQAAADVIRVITSTFRAGNGRVVGIEADDGEKCFIVHSDQIFALEAALKAETVGFIVANGNQDKFRRWDAEGPAWTEIKKKAVLFVRREDAEAVFAEDEDAWAILPVTAADLA